MREVLKAKRSKAMFHLAIGMTIFVVLAFGSAAMVQPFRVERYIKPFVLIHIITSLSWMALFIYQSKLILKGKIKQHTDNVKLGLVLVIVLTLMAIYITYEWRSAARLVAESRDVIVFSLLFIWGIRKAKIGKFDWHTRLILAAALNLINPAFIRLVNALGLPVPSVILFTLAALIIVPIAYDRATLGKIHKASVVGMVISISSYVLVIAIAFSPLIDLIEILIYGSPQNVKL